MKKVIEKIKEKKSFDYLVIIIVGILISIPLIWLSMRSTDDGWFHLLRLVGLENSIEYGSFPFLIQPFFCNDWGYSMTSLYPTIVAYVPYFISLIMGSFVTGIKLFAAVTVILSGIFMYKFVTEVTGKRRVSLLAAVIYMSLPYRLEDIYNRFAIGEFTAFVFVPLVFLGLYNLLNGDRKKHYYITIGAAGLILSHTISTVYTAIFCVLYILLNIKKFAKKDVITKCVINVVFILLITAIFWVPMLEFKNSTEYAIFNPDLLRTKGEYVAGNTIELWQFIKDKGEENGVSFIIGIPFIAMFVLGIFAYRRLKPDLKKLYMTFLLFAIISIFMCTKYFPWEYMPNFLCTLQYPWRMLGFALFFLTPICAMNVCYLIYILKKEYVRDIVYVVVFVILAIFTTKELLEYKTDEENLDYEYEQEVVENPIISYYSLNRDYMPYNAIMKQNSYLTVREDNTLVLSGKATIENEEKEAFHLEFEIEDARKNTELELPFLYYPGYTVILEYGDTSIELETIESINGFVEIIIPEDIESGKITVEYTGTTLEKSAYILSGIALIVFVIYVVQFKKRKKGETNEE